MTVHVLPQLSPRWQALRVTSGQNPLALKKASCLFGDGCDCVLAFHDATRPWFPAGDGRRGFSGQQVRLLFRQPGRRITRRPERVRPRQPSLWSYQNVRDVAAVRGLNSQRDIFRELKLIIQSPVRGARVYNISASKKKQEIHAKGS